MKRRWIRYGTLGVGGAVLAGFLVLPATGVLAATPGAGAGVAQVALVRGGATGKTDPCVPEGKPGKSPTPTPTGKPTGEPSGKPTGTPTGKPTPAPTGKPSGSDGTGGQGKAGGQKVQVALVCGTIAKRSDHNGTTVLVIKTPKGAVTVLVPPQAPVWKGDVKVARKVLQVGVAVIVKAEVVGKNTFRAAAVILR